jgi:hypothetical protein
MPEELFEKPARQAVAATRKTRTIYVREEDQPIWDEAKDIVGESLSAYLTNHLRTMISAHEAAAAGSQRILLSFRESGIAKTKGFYGRWLISPEKPFAVWHLDINGDEDPSYPPNRYAVAITAKNNIVVFKFGERERKENGKFDWGELRVFDSFEMANTHEEIPLGLIAEAMEVLGVEVEELDI